MSFRRNRHNIAYVQWHGDEVCPPAGRFTVYYWRKGTPVDKNNPQPGETWVKADVYGPGGEIYLCGILADNLNQLRKRVEQELGISGP